MKRCIVTLVSAPAESVEVPKHFPRARGEKGDPKEIERSGFGALRFFPGVPKTISCAEHEFIQRERPDVAARLERTEYVESKRVDYRGASEAEVEKLAAEAGLGHLSHAEQCARLTKAGKLKPDPKKASSTEIRGKGKTAKAENGNGGKTSRKPR